MSREFELVKEIKEILFVYSCSDKLKIIDADEFTCGADTRIIYFVRRVKEKRPVTVDLLQVVVRISRPGAEKMEVSTAELKFECIFSDEIGLKTMIQHFTYWLKGLVASQ